MPIQVIRGRRLIKNFFKIKSKIYIGLKYKKIIFSIFIVISLLLTCFFGLFFNQKSSGNAKSELIENSKSPYIEKTKENLANQKGFFTKNQGQLENDEIFFTYSSNNLNFGFLESSILIKLSKKIENSTIQISIIKINFEKSNKVVPKGQEELKHKTNYFIGDDSSKWKSNVLNFKKIIYENLYDGIDLVYYFDENGLKYDWIIETYADPNKIVERFEGIDTIKIDNNGELLVKTNAGELKEKKPYCYQEISRNIKDIKIDFKIKHENSIAYEIGDYDASQILIIDPLIYSTYLGGGGNDGFSEASIALDSENNAYILGDTYSWNFPTTPGCYNDSRNGSCDIFVSKLNKNGTSLLYSTYIGGKYDDWSENIVLDSENNAYITGATYSPNFPITIDCYSKSINGTKDVFILKLSSDGSILEYSTYVGGYENDYGKNIVIDSENNAYVTGWTESSNFPTTNGCYDDLYNGGFDIFLLKINSNGSDLIYSTFIGGNDEDYSYSTVIDTKNQVYLTGKTKSLDFPTTSGCYNDSHSGGEFDVFVLKFNITTSDLIYSTFIGGNDEDKSYDITLDSSNNTYVTGYTESQDFPTTPDCYDNSLNGTSDIYIFKLNQNGTDLLASTFIGGTDSDYSYDIELDSNNMLYITGFTKSTDFPITIGCFDNTLNGSRDAFILKMDYNCSRVLYSSFIGGDWRDYGYTIKLDIKNYVYITGCTNSWNFPTTINCYNNRSSGNYDVFVLKYDCSPKITPIIKSISPNYALEGENIFFEGIGIDGNIIQYSWRSDIEGEFYNGSNPSFFYSNLSNGTHSIYFKVKNNTRWSEEISSSITINGIPRAKINNIIPNIPIEDEIVYFYGNGTDDGVIKEYKWTSSLNGHLSSKKEFNTSDLFKGIHTISFKVKDDFDVWSEVGFIQLKVNCIPIAKIDKNTPDYANEHESIWFYGNGTDDGAIESYEWWSSIDNFLRNEKLFSVSNLSNGTHIIYFKVKDNYNVWSEEVSKTLTINGIPRAKIDEITPSIANESDTIRFYAHGIDDGIIIEYEWYSSIDGFLSNKKLFSCSNLTNGTHTIFFIVRDNYKIWSDNVSNTITINGIPRAKIDEINPLIINEGENVCFNGKDTDDGKIVNYYWSSSIDGFLSDYKSFCLSNLSNGTHVIDFRVKDDNSVWSSVVFATIKINGIPRCKIDEIKPILANKGENVRFFSNGTDDGKILEYHWHSDIDGFLSNEKSFFKSDLTIGEHTIFLKVQDNMKIWSKENSMKLTILQEHKHVIDVTILSNQKTVDKDIKIYTLSGTASIENGELTKVQIKIDDGDWQDAVGTYNWTFDWDISNISKGNHTVSIRAMEDDSCYKIETINIYVNGADEVINTKESFKTIYLASIIGIFIIVIIGFLFVGKIMPFSKEDEIYKEIEEKDSTEKESIKTEKEILLRELHHRVKNNLQVISSLLYLQSEEFKDKEVILLKFRVAEERIKSMALIHETLYRSKDLEKVDFASYIKTLASNLFISYGEDYGRIKLEIDVKSEKLDLNHSIPLGLIINELISNSLKHAFPDNRNGTIKIGLYSTDENIVELIISDNGIGMQKDFDIKTTKTLGLRLVTILIEDQLDGEIILDKGKGTTFHIYFKE